MTVVINGTTGITSVNGTAAAPSVTGTDTDTGIVYGTNTITLATNGTAGLVQNSVQGVQVPNTIGVGGTTPSTSGAGISFPATQSASTDANTLDDYEEGTFTPTLTFSGNSVGMTYSRQVGSYTKVGRFVSGSLRIDLTNKGSSTGTPIITGLPFVCASGQEYNGGGFYALMGGAFLNGSVAQQVIIDNGNNTMTLRYTDASGNQQSHSNSDFGNSTYFAINFCYQTA